jgi:hypothetical protein
MVQKIIISASFLIFTFLILEIIVQATSSGKEILAHIENVDIRASLLVSGQVNLVVSLSETQLNNIINASLIIEVEKTNNLGDLIVIVNEREVYRNRTSIGVISIPVNKTFLGHNNTIIIKTEFSGLLQFWKTSMYELKRVDFEVEYGTISPTLPVEPTPTPLKNANVWNIMAIDNSSSTCPSFINYQIWEHHTGNCGNVTVPLFLNIPRGNSTNFTIFATLGEGEGACEITLRIISPENKTVETGKYILKKKVVLPPTAACEGCFYGSSCLPYGTRIIKDGIPSFCDVTKEFLPQKEDGESCQNNYECKSNTCSDGVCISLKKELEAQKGLLQKILDLLMNLFSFLKIKTSPEKPKCIYELHLNPRYSEVVVEEKVPQKPESEVDCRYGLLDISNLRYCNNILEGTILNKGSVKLQNITIYIIYPAPQAPLKYPLCLTGNKVIVCDVANLSVDVNEIYKFNIPNVPSNFDEVRVTSHCPGVYNRVSKEGINICISPMYENCTKANFDIYASVYNSTTKTLTILLENKADIRLKITKINITLKNGTVDVRELNLLLPRAGGLLLIKVENVEPCEKFRIVTECTEPAVFREGNC